MSHALNTMKNMVDWGLCSVVDVGWGWWEKGWVGGGGELGMGEDGWD